MKNSKLRRALLLAACAVMLVCLSVGATLAYLTATTNDVQNTFTVGNVSFDDPALNDALDEARVNEYGQPVKDVPALDENGDPILDENGDPTTKEEVIPVGEAERRDYNVYKLIPGHTYTKDPTVHMGATSEDAWLFVKVDNGIAAIEAAGSTTIAAQMTARGWTQIAEGSDIWYYNRTVKADEDIVVFESFTLNADLPETTLDQYESASINIQAYAIQADNFEAAMDAWNADPLEAWTTTSTPDTDDTTGEENGETA